MARTNPNKAIWFNLDEQKLYEKMRAAGKVSQSLKDFVHSAFYDKIDKINNRISEGGQ
ncbi:MAG: hypothetical protein QME12_06600 [Nanoarchaeota archaeon]|nr:hypothetical protein [Nanoarchaeota archaeon]